MLTNVSHYDRIMGNVQYDFAHWASICKICYSNGWYVSYDTNCLHHIFIQSKPTHVVVKSFLDPV